MDVAMIKDDHDQRKRLPEAVRWCTLFLCWRGASARGKPKPTP